MSNDPNQGGEEEFEAAEDRIAKIRQAGAAQPGSEGGYQQDLGEPDLEALSRARSRSRTLGGDTGGSAASSRAPARRPAARGNQALILIGGLVGIGILIVVIIVLVGMLGGGAKGFSLPFLSTATPTATATPAATVTPTVTPTATATKVAPNLALPPLTCIFQSGVGCFDYCNDPANKAECDSARAFVQAQGADPEKWLQCIASGPGANTGNPQTCLEDAWRANNP